MLGGQLSVTQLDGALGRVSFRLCSLNAAGTGEV